MLKTITFACGHVGDFRVYGKGKTRDWQIANAEATRVCPECYKKLVEEKRIQKNEEALKMSEEMDLPKLSGSEKQVAWATTIRIDLLDAIQGRVDHATIREEAETNEEKRKLLRDRIEQTVSFIEYFITSKTKASWFIDHRYDTFDKLYSIEEEDFEEWLEEQKSDRELEKDAEREMEKESVEESIIKTENTKYPGYVDIINYEDKIRAIYEKNEDFIAIVKGLGYKWDGVWERKLSEMTGPYEDRAAELGNTLLSAGFAVCIYDQEIRRKAIEADYQEECNRWVARNGEGSVRIFWDNRNDDLYTQARRITGSWYKSPYVCVKVTHYEEIEDFANINGFSFTKLARKEIDEYKKKIEGAIVAEPAEKQQEEEKDKLEEILETSREVLADLKDDDYADENGTI